MKFFSVISIIVYKTCVKSSSLEYRAKLAHITVNIYLQAQFKYTKINHKKYSKNNENIERDRDE